MDSDGKRFFSKPVFLAAFPGGRPATPGTNPDSTLLDNFQVKTCGVGQRRADSPYPTHGADNRPDLSGLQCHRRYSASDKRYCPGPRASSFIRVHFVNPSSAREVHRMNTHQLPLAATEYSIWSDSAHTNFSGSTDGRPFEEYVSWKNGESSALPGSGRFSERDLTKHSRCRPSRGTLLADNVPFSSSAKR